MHFTQNPIGSDDQLDLQDNAISFDYAMNSPAASWQDRFGKQHKTVQQALKDVGFKPAGFDFVSGGTLEIGDRDKCVFYPTDGYWYSWNGKLPYVVPANSSPAPGGKKGWGIVTRDERVVAREALRRTYQEVGLNLVEGSFEQGGVLVNTNDVLLHEATGKVYSGPAGVVAAGTNPTSGGFMDRSRVLLSDSVARSFGAGVVKSDRTFSVGFIVTDKQDRLNAAEFSGLWYIYTGTTLPYTVVPNTNPTLSSDFILVGKLTNYAVNELLNYSHVVTVNGYEVSAGINDAILACNYLGLTLDLPKGRLDVSVEVGIMDNTKVLGVSFEDTRLVQNDLAKSLIKFKKSPYAATDRFVRGVVLEHFQVGYATTLPTVGRHLNTQAKALDIPASLSLYSSHMRLKVFNAHTGFHVAGEYFASTMYFEFWRCYRGFYKGMASGYGTSLDGHMGFWNCTNPVYAPKVYYSTISMFFDHCGLSSNGNGSPIDYAPSDEVPVMLYVNNSSIDIPYLGDEGGKGIQILCENFASVNIGTYHYTADTGLYWARDPARIANVPFAEQALFHAKEGRINITSILISDAGPISNAVSADTPLFYVTGYNGKINFENSVINTSHYYLHDVTPSVGNSRAQVCRANTDVSIQGVTAIKGSNINGYVKGGFTELCYLRDDITRFLRAWDKFTTDLTVKLTTSGTVLTIPIESQGSRNVNTSIELTVVDDDNQNSSNGRIARAQINFGSFTSIRNLSSTNLLGITSVTSSGMNILVTFTSSIGKPIVNAKVVSGAVNVLNKQIVDLFGATLA